MESIERIKEQLTCSVCLNIFEEPKELPCHHIYCKECLVGLLKRSGNQSVVCPLCRTVAQIPDDNLDNVPTAFHIEHLKEAYTALLKHAATVGTATAMCPATVMCSAHQDQPSDHYCKNCQKQVCRSCVQIKCEPEGHLYNKTATVAGEYRESILENLVPTEQLEEQMSTALSEVTNIKSQITKQKQSLTRDINSAFDRMVSVLQDQRRALLQNLEEVTSKKECTISLQEQQLQAASTELTEFVKSTKQTLTAESHEKVLSCKQETIAKINEVTHRLRRVPQSPAERPNVVMSITDVSEELRTLCEHCWSISCNTVDPSKCTATGEGLRQAETDKVATFSVHLADSKGDPCVEAPIVTVELKLLSYNITTPAQVIFTSAALCEVFFESDVRGTHELSVKINDVSIPNSPFPIFIRKPLDQIQAPLDKITAVSNPGCLAHKNGYLYICNLLNKGSISVLDHKHNTIPLQIDLRDVPVGIAVDNDFFIYVRTFSDDKLHKFTSTGSHVRSIKISTFDYAHDRSGMRISRDNRLFVCDSIHHRILVFNTDLLSKCSLVIGKKGQRAGQFNFPTDLDFDDSGRMYVADSLNHRIQVLAQNGNCEYTIGAKGSGPGELLCPVCIQVENKLLYVVERDNHRVSVFHTSGDFIATFGKGYLHKPDGIAVDQEGYIYVSSGKNAIFRF